VENPKVEKCRVLQVERLAMALVRLPMGEAWARSTFFVERTEKMES